MVVAAVAQWVRLYFLTAIVQLRKVSRFVTML